MKHLFLLLFLALASACAVHQSYDVRQPNTFGADALEIYEGATATTHDVFPQSLKLCGTITDILEGYACIVRETTLLLPDAKRYPGLFDLRRKETSVALEWFLMNVQGLGVPRELSAAYSAYVAQGKSLERLNYAKDLINAGQEIINAGQDSGAVAGTNHAEVGKNHKVAFSKACASKGYYLYGNDLDGYECCTGGRTSRECLALPYFFPSPYVGIRRITYPHVERPNSGQTRVYGEEFRSVPLRTISPTNRPNSGRTRVYGEEFRSVPLRTIHPE